MKKMVWMLALFAAAPVGAQGMRTMELANQLGTIIGSERACNLSYDLDAIDRYIDEHADPADMGFPGMLQMMTDGQEYSMRDIGESALRAHCRSVERTARHYGFIE